MRKVTREEYVEYVKPYLDKFMANSGYLGMYRSIGVPECLNYLADKLQDEFVKDYKAGKLPCLFFALVEFKETVQGVEYYTDCEGQIKPSEVEECEDIEEDEDNNENHTLSDYSSEELLLELLCRVHNGKLP